MTGAADVQAGICGHRTTIDAETSDGRQVTFAVETTCDNIERYAARLAADAPFDAYAEIDPRTPSRLLAPPYGETHVCTDCVVPAAALKALRVAAGLALPGDVAVAIAKE